MSHSENPTTPVLSAAQAAALASQLDNWLWWCGRVERPATRVVLTPSQMNGLDRLGVLDWSWFEFPSRVARALSFRGVDKFASYRGLRIVVQEGLRQ